jgi:hypothetical protein
MKQRKAIEAIQLIMDELVSAEAKHPLFPNDPIHAVAIMAEECGEAVQAAIDFVYQDGIAHRQVNRRKLQKELAQTGAMAVRNLINMHNFDPIKSSQK